MSTYQLNFEQIRQHARLDALLAALERGFAAFGIDFYLVGAVSRDVWMSGVHHLKPRRTTGDIDFAVFINDKGVYEALKDYLITREGFTAYHQNAFVLLYADGTEVDLLPFGAIEDDNRRVTVQGTGYTSVHVEGFHEVYNNQLPTVALGDHVFKVCSLPGIVLLKLIAWQDRPDTRQGDILDICDILHHYFDMHSSVIYDQHADIFIDERLEQATVTELAARVMGREIRVIAARNARLLERITHLLAVNTRDAATSAIAIRMVAYFNNTLADNLRLLRYLQTGFSEQRPLSDKL